MAQQARCARVDWVSGLAGCAVFTRTVAVGKIKCSSRGYAFGRVVEATGEAKFYKYKLELCPYFLVMPLCEGLLEGGLLI